MHWTMNYSKTSKIINIELAGLKNESIRILITFWQKNLIPRKHSDPKSSANLRFFEDKHMSIKISL